MPEDNQQYNILNKKITTVEDLVKNFNLIQKSLNGDQTVQKLNNIRLPNDLKGHLDKAKFIKNNVEYNASSYFSEAKLSQAIDNIKKGNSKQDDKDLIKDYLDFLEKNLQTFLSKEQFEAYQNTKKALSSILGRMKDPAVSTAIYLAMLSIIKIYGYVAGINNEEKDRNLEKQFENILNALENKNPKANVGHSDNKPNPYQYGDDDGDDDGDDNDAQLEDGEGNNQKQLIEHDKYSNHQEQIQDEYHDNNQLTSIPDNNNSFKEYAQEDSMKNIEDNKRLFQKKNDRDPKLNNSNTDNYCYGFKQ